MVQTVLVISMTGLLVGGICLGAGVAMGRLADVLCERGGHPCKENQRPRTAQITGWRARKRERLKHPHRTAEADIRIVPGDQFLAEYVLNGQRLSPQYSVSDGTLTLRESGEWKSSANFGFLGGIWGSGKEASAPYIQITVPKNAALSEVELSARYGDISMDSDLKSQKPDRICGKRRRAHGGLERRQL